MSSTARAECRPWPRPVRPPGGNRGATAVAASSRNTARTRAAAPADDDDDLGDVGPDDLPQCRAEPSGPTVGEPPARGAAAALLAVGVGARGQLGEEPWCAARGARHPPCRPGATATRGPITPDPRPATRAGCAGRRGAGRPACRGPAAAGSP